MSKYTFLLPAFKAKYLGKALESIKNQTYHDFNVIVSDDCSPEDIKSVYDEHVGHASKGMQPDYRFVFRRNEKNMGGKSLVSHWNLLLDMCRSEYLIMASDDDFYEPNFLEEIDKLINKYPEVGVVKGRSKSIDADDRILYQDANIPEYQSLYQHLVSKYEQTYIAGIPQFVFKTSILKSIGGFPEYPDACFSDDAVVMMCARDGICTTPKVVFGFRTSYINLSSKMSLSYASRKIEADKQFDVWMSKWLATYHDPESDLEERVIYGLRNHVFHHFLDHYYLLPLPEIIENYKWASKRGYLKTAGQKLHYISFVPLLKVYRFLRNHNVVIRSDNYILSKLRTFALGK